ncbi:MAG: aspartate 1-decarboxylase [Verrucomicrobiia bacterium]
MQITMLKCKLHRATVTDASLDYEGSMTIAADLAERAGLLEFEKILVGNITNGNRFETYVIHGPAGSRAIVLNGATAHLGKVGDRLVIMAFAQMTPEDAVNHRARTLVLDEANHVVTEK